MKKVVLFQLYIYIKYSNILIYFVNHFLIGCGIMNDVIFEFIAMDLLKFLAVFCLVWCARVKYLHFKAVLMRKHFKGFCKIA